MVRLAIQYAYQINTAVYAVQVCTVEAAVIIVK